jgi:hypothetical protein
MGLVQGEHPAARIITSVRRHRSDMVPALRCGLDLPPTKRSMRPTRGPVTDMVLPAARTTAWPFSPRPSLHDGRVRPHKAQARRRTRPVLSSSNSRSAVSQNSTSRP